MSDFKIEGRDEMTVNSLLSIPSVTPLHLADGEREFDSCYIGDLLSWVMGRAKADSVWITIMSNVNVLAVATLADCAAVILAEGVMPDGEFIELARAKGVNLFASSLPAYESALALSDLLP